MNDVHYLLTHDAARVTISNVVHKKILEVEMNVIHSTKLNGTTGSDGTPMDPLILIAPIVAWPRGFLLQVF
jgi:hypothetical protein